MSMGRLTHRYRKRRIRKESRTRPVPGHRDYGNGEDDGRYFKCWNCGFYCDVQRDALGDGESQSNINYPQAVQKYSPDGFAISQYGAAEHGHIDGVPLLTVATIGDGICLMEKDAAGDNKTVYLNYYPDVNTGCPFCGTLNWRGDY
jgi:hypothetical protein